MGLLVVQRGVRLESRRLGVRGQELVLSFNAEAQSFV